MQPADRGDSAAHFLIRLGRALHEAGFSAPQLESALAGVAEKLAVPAQFFSTPTSLFISFGEGAAQRTHLERVNPASIDLGRLADLEALLDRVRDGRTSPADASAEISDLARRPRRYSRKLTYFCWGLASATSAVFLGGSLREVAVAGFVGLVTGLVAFLAESRPSAERLFEPAAAAFAAFTAAVVAQAAPPLSVYIATVAGLIVLLPGYSLTVALSELAARHLSSGTARFAGALVTFLMIGLGVAIGGRLATATLSALVASPAAIGGERSTGRGGDRTRSARLATARCAPARAPGALGAAARSANRGPLDRRHRRAGLFRQPVGCRTARA